MEDLKKNECPIEMVNFLKCTACSQGKMSLSGSEHVCCDCGAKYSQSYGVIDSLIELSGPTRSEILGMALENGYTEENFLDFKIQIHKEYRKISEKLKSTEGTHSNYYLQTLMNFEQALETVSFKEGDKVLEIGACYDYYFLKPFREKGCQTYAINIHYDLVEEDLYEDYPVKVLGDMNNLPFQDESFDVVLLSATSHHSTTPELLIRELFRVLKPGGKCLMINDPTWGLIKNLGGPDNTIAYRESHINENEYAIWKYNSWFRDTGFSYQHFFSRFWDDLLLNKKILPGTRFYFFAKLFQKAWKISLFNKMFKKYGLWFLQAVFGFPMNVVLRKP